MTITDVKAASQAMIQSPPGEPCVIVIFGASGDLTHRELIPALYNLRCKELLPDPCAIVGFAKKTWDDDAFRDEMRETVSGGECGMDHWEEFARRMFYVPGDFNDAPKESYIRLLQRVERLQEEFDIPDNVLCYLSVPPMFYSTIVQRISAAGLSKSDEGWRRIIIEKPFGRDERSTRELEKEIHEVFSEDQIFRVDHFLGKETVQNMLAFRFGNPAFEPIWNRNYIANIQITAAEPLGMEGRGKFYDSNGVVRDMVQNHLLQLICMATIEPPVRYSGDSLRSETVKVLDAVCETVPERDWVLGQYTSSTSGDENVPAYRDEPNVASDSTTPTFAACRLMIDNWRWAGVPIYARTGKRMSRKTVEVTIVFKKTPHLMFGSEEAKKNGCNILTFRVSPDEGIHYTFLAKKPGAGINLTPVDMSFCYNSTFGIEKPPSAYEWLLYDAMQGDQTLFPRADWIYKAWEIVDPVIAQWEKKPWSDVVNYGVGSWGPAAAYELIQRDGNQWLVR